MLHHGPAMTGFHRQTNNNESPNKRKPPISSSSNTPVVSIPIPNQASKHRHQSTNDSSSSGDSISMPDGKAVEAEHSPITAFSRSASNQNSGTPLNVYSMSPRSTSVMFQYYSTPRGYYQHKPISRTKSSEHANAQARRKLVTRTISECGQVPITNGSDVALSPPPPRQSVLPGLPHLTHNDVLEDPRRRAWSESDSQRKNGSMHNSRMSALRKLKQRLKRTGSLKKKKDEHSSTDTLNTSAPSANSLLKAEEGRKDVNLNTSQELVNSVGGLSLHEEHETARTPTRTSGHLCSPNHNNNPLPQILNPEADLIYQRFLEEHTCYDIMPTSCKLVVFDTQLLAGKAFHALLANAVRSAPLWDSQHSRYVGMLTVTDFIHVLIAYSRLGKSPQTLEEESLDTWRKILHQEPDFENVSPENTLLDSLGILFEGNYHGVPVLDQASGDIFHIINHKRILRFLYLFMNELPAPSFMGKTVEEAGIGTYDNVCTVRKDQSLLHVLQVISERKLTAIPVVDQSGDVVDVFCKLDMIPLAAQGMHYDLTVALETALSCRFAALFEDEMEPVNFTRFASPKPQRRVIQQSSDTGPTPPQQQRPRENAPRLTSLLDEYASTKNRGNPVSASLQGHSVQPVKPNQSPRLSGGGNTRPPFLRQHSLPLDGVGSSTNQCEVSRSRHKSLSNPLVKCRLTDSIQFVIDLLVSSDANLLVVVGRHDSHVIGVVTVSDVLRFIIDPQGRKFHRPKRKSQSGVEATATTAAAARTTSSSSKNSSSRDATGSNRSSESSLPPTDDLSALAQQLDCEDGPGAPLFRARHRSSDHVLNDSGYTSSTSLSRRKSSETRQSSSVSFADQTRCDEPQQRVTGSSAVNGRFLRAGAQIERL